MSINGVTPTGPTAGAWRPAQAEATPLSDDAIAAGLGLPAAADGSQPGAPAMKPPLPFLSTMLALLNSEAFHRSAGAPGEALPPLSGDLARAHAAGGLQLASHIPAGAQVGDGPDASMLMTHSDDGSTAAASLEGRDASEMANELIADGGGDLTLSGFEKALGVTGDTDADKKIAKAVATDWAKLAHGGSGPLSAADLAAALQSYKKSQGSEILTGGVL